MATTEDQKPDLKPGGSHNNVGLSPKEQTEFDQLPADYDDIHDYYKDSGKKSSGMGGKLSAAAMATTPLGRIKALFSKNKKAAITGGGIFGFIIGIAVFFSIVFGSGQLIWMNSVFQDFNFGPHDRSIAGRANRTIDHIRTGRSNNTQLGRKIESISNDSAKQANISEIDGEKTSKFGRRTPFRNVIGTRISGGIVWRFFNGASRGSPNFTSARNKMLGIDNNNTRGDTRVEEISVDEDGEQVRTEDPSRSNDINDITSEIKNNPNESRSIARRAARRVSSSAIVATVMIGCLSAAYDDLIPDDQEKYEMLLSMGANFLISGSQLAYGEEVHGDEVADTMSAYEDTIEAEGEYDEDGELISSDGTVHRSFSDSAAWKRATNQPTSGNEEDAELRYDTLADVGLIGGTVKTVGGFVNTIPGSGTACSFIGNPVIGFTAALAEGVAAFFSGGTTAAVKVALKEGAFIAALSFLFEQVSFESVIPDGPAMLMASQDMGMNLSQSEYSRSQGAPPVSNEVANAMRSQHYIKLAAEDRQKGVVWRHLSPENHRSTLSRVAVSTDLNASSLLKSIAKIPSNIPALLSKALSGRADANRDFHNYNIQQYAFSDEDLNLDPLENASYVENALRCGGGADTQPGDNCTEGKTTEGEVMLEIFNNCINTNQAYWQIEGDDLCTNPSASERSAWVKVGVWNLDNNLVDSLDCLSHDQPCGNASRNDLGELDT